MEHSSGFQTKRIDFLGRKVTILLQNLNGPCPLLALANVLLLRNTIKIHSDISVMSLERLIELLANELVELNPLPGDLAMQANHQQQLMDALSVLPNLQVGLDVNVRFQSCTDFEYTKELTIFDMFGVTLRHGWLVDPQDVETLSAIGNASYNQLVELLVRMDELQIAASREESDSKQQEESSTAAAAAAAAGEQMKGNEIDETRPSEANTEMTAGTSSSNNSDDAKKNEKEEEEEEKGASNDKSREEKIEREKLMHQGLIVQNFLQSTASQLTYHGLVELHSHVRPNELGVFFRNNHFSTMFKHDDRLYLLETDLGYLHEPSVVWQVFAEVGGDHMFCDGSFKPFRPHNDSGSNNKKAAAAAMQPKAAPPPPQDYMDSDLQLAMRMQQLEYDAERTQQQNRMRQQPNAPMHQQQNAPMYQQQNVSMRQQQQQYQQQYQQQQQVPPPQQQHAQAVESYRKELRTQRQKEKEKKSDCNLM